MALQPPVSTNDHIEGKEDALIELVEYGDYECPHCGRAYYIVKKMQQQLGNKLKFIFRNFPLTKIHPLATPAAVATEAADLQGKYWEIHDIIFENQESLEPGSFLEFAGQLGMNIKKFKKDLQDPALTEKVEAHFESGIRSGVNATPTFFINGIKYNDGWEGDRMMAYIKREFPDL
jgi:protein-disulfide isomerase